MKTVKIKFEGIDDWNRPVYKDVDSKSRYGDTNKLFSWDATKEKVDNYFLKNTDELCYFGESFNCEPNGGLNVKLEII